MGTSRLFSKTVQNKMPWGHYRKESKGILARPRYHTGEKAQLQKWVKR